MAFQVVHAIGRNLQVAGQALRKTSTYQERSHKARARGIGNGVDILQFDTGFLDGRFCNGGNLLQMGACRNFRDNSSIKGVFVNLTVKRVRKDFYRIVLQNGAGGFVAAGFNS